MLSGRVSSCAPGADGRLMESNAEPRRSASDPRRLDLQVADGNPSDNVSGVRWESMLDLRLAINGELFGVVCNAAAPKGVGSKGTGGC